MSHAIKIFKCLILLLSISCISYLFYTHRKDNTYYLWNGTHLAAKNTMDKDIEIINCGNGECNQIMRNWLLNMPGLAFVCVSLLEPSAIPVIYTYLDTIWIVVLGCVSLMLVSEIVLIIKEYLHRNM